MRLGVSVMASLIIGVAAGLTAAAAGAQGLDSPCDGDHNDRITAPAAQGCAERRFNVAGESADGLSEEQFAAAFSYADGLRHQFTQVDQDGDGRISREEWMSWFGPAHAGTTNGAGGRHSGTD